MSSLALAVDATLSGAGRAGLVAATDLRAAGRKVVVLQACDPLCGRTESVRLAEADLEAGGPGGRRTWRQADLEAGGPGGRRTWRQADSGPGRVRWSWLASPGISVSWPVPPA
jgi:hypothetical protein